MHSSSQRSILAHMSSASKKRSWKTGVQICSSWKRTKHLPCLHLSCLFLVFLIKCCNVFSLEPTGSMFASSPFCRLACRGAISGGFPFPWVLHFVLSSTRSVIVHDTASCSREILSLNGRPCDALSCLFSALWLQQSQSLLVAGDQFPAAYIQRALPASTRPVGDRMLFKHTADITTYNAVGWMWPFLSKKGIRCITWNTRVLLDLFFPDKGTESSN